jgi:heme/copper-type cytochrome/quinol oxidase subunit 3
MTVVSSALKRGLAPRCEQHRWHLVNPSPWPFVVAFGVFQVLLSLILAMHGVDFYYYSNVQSEFFVRWLDLAATICPLLWAVQCWLSDVVAEGTYEGQHTKAVQTNLKFGMLLFITSEVFFFLAFFWTFFHFSLVPVELISSRWPVPAIRTLNPWSIPLLNTALLLSSGVTLTWAHRALVAGSHISTVHGLLLTIIYGCVFTLFQGYEYSSASFGINDTSYGSIFFVGTGFHGLHVMIGTLMLIVCLVRQIDRHFLRLHHVGFETAAWYWHFVDVVWLCLFLIIYAHSAG